MKPNQKQIRCIIIFLVTTIIGFIDPSFCTVLQVCILIWDLWENCDR
ncbi:hypothetical protein [Floridanema aerugineum]|uniref:Uncharacterized protein n=1 Tax=Floridaenema aerugineum BLCC-F46 TaxID=3153654 RepID=A0ABV4XHG7_9CYAN